MAENSFLSEVTLKGLRDYHFIGSFKLKKKLLLLVRNSF